jgi:hypothetical protein
VTADRDRTLQADRLDIVDDLAVLPFVTRTRIEHGDPRNRDHFDLLRARYRHQAASDILTGAAMS